MIENIDRWVGRLVAEVDQRGEMNNTIIVYASDHGEMLGDRGRWGKVVPYQPSLGVPLIIAGPGVQAGRIQTGPATILDLPSTFLDYAGVSQNLPSESRSLRPLLEGHTANGRDYVSAALNNWRVVYNGRHKLIETAGSDRQLFDMTADPYEMHNIALDIPDVCQQLLAML